MGTILGSVTKIKGNNLGFGSSAFLGGQEARNASFSARNGDNVAAGFFASAGQAQRAIDRSVGRRLRWTREDLPGGVEHYVARVGVDPLDIWGEDLRFWGEVTPEGTGGIRIGSTPAAPTPATIQVYGDRSGRKNDLRQIVVADQPDLAGLGGVPNLRFNVGDEQSMLNSGVVVSTPGDPATPINTFYITVYASYSGAAGVSRSFLTLLGVNPYSLRTDGAGAWRAGNDLGGVTGGVADGDAKVVSCRQAPLEVALRVEQVDIGSLVLAGGADIDGSVRLCVAAPAVAWDGNVFMVCISVGSGEASDIRVRQTEDYALRRFRIS